MNKTIEVHGNEVPVKNWRERSEIREAGYSPDAEDADTQNAARTGGEFLECGQLAFDSETPLQIGEDFRVGTRAYKVIGSSGTRYRATYFTVRYKETLPLG